MNRDDLRVRDEALAWVRRIDDSDFADWDAHIAWLEADPLHAGVFDAMALAIDDATTGLAPGARARPAAASNDNAVPAAVATAPRSRRRWIGASAGLAIAAGIAGIVTLPGLLPDLLDAGPQIVVMRTRPGERRMVSLADGTRLTLNGDSAVRIDRADPRLATLDRGEAFFAVMHDAAHPFTVRAGDATFQDIGTAFDVVRDGGGTRLAVREGAVLYDPAGAGVRLAPGDAIEVARREAVVRRVDAGAVGGWRAGRLTFADAPMAQVAADLSRSIGEPVRIEGGAATRRFSGVIVVDADRDRMFRRVAAITGIGVRRDGGGWRMALPVR